MKFTTPAKLLTVLTAAISVAAQYDQDYGDYGDYGSGNANDYQDYGNDYGQDNLYQDYADRQEAKAAPAAGGFGWGQMAAVGAISYFCGAKIHSGRIAKRMKVRHQKEQKQLYTQYYNDVYKLSEQNQQLVLEAEKLQEALRSTKDQAEYEKLQRDYDEFKQPDLDGDDRISRAEFNMYVQNYLANYPGLTEKDYPVFEDFDHDKDGFVSFQEYAQQMAIHVKQAEMEQQQQKNPNSQKAQALNDLYKSTGGGRF
mmetsp:Transcript_8142/g.22093  ORF Transcript_8142/g.22093 Transcript_8142/m.22093 type:complete len:255 (-) Transcript_8142:917-1681(-)|eukprot:CAMPEP_0198117232 /NCGR_PEP_ID=MMETSP1442-20131203/17281_1 /TAXON_ID= /ORGANISM="Craspedostauros australis, Strain CCMP3328" /LENGTH=254 /DNA_ID=CAMNT_0043775241 /DNA_START=297 /DNA_END=1061 /DNA_ORIENTATION=+